MRYLALLMLALAPQLAGAQSTWTVTAERGWTTYSSAAHDTSSDPAQLRAWRPALYSLRLSRESGRIGLSLAAGIAFGEWGVNIGDFVVLPDQSLRLFEIAPDVSVRLRTTTIGSVVRLHAGPILDIWSPTGDETRQRIGLMAGVSLEQPLGGRWSTSLRADVALSSSLLNKDEEDGQTRRESSMRRGRLALGLMRRL